MAPVLRGERSGLPDVVEDSGGKYTDPWILVRYISESGHRDGDHEEHRVAVSGVPRYVPLAGGIFQQDEVPRL